MDEGARALLPLTLVVLAGGTSRRMKRDKALLPVGGKKLVEIVVDEVGRLFAEVLVSVSPGRRYDFLSVRQIPDAASGLGPVAGILAGLAAARHDLAFILACDIPFVDPDFVARLASSAAGFDVCVPKTSKGLEPLLAIYRKTTIPFIERLLAEGKRSVLDLYPLCRTNVVDVGDPDWLRNINTPDDYKSFLKAR